MHQAKNRQTGETCQGFFSRSIFGCMPSRLIRYAAQVLVLGIASINAHAQTPPARDLVSDAVGATAGVFAVDQSGQATYSIAIATPPGTAGVAPTLSLDYSSQGNTHVMGKGWSLGGQSSIGRCRKTREAGDFLFHGDFGFPPHNLFEIASPVSFNHLDVFCLDGQRLLLISGTYGGHNAVYRPELDPWTKVTSKGGNSSDNPATYTGPQHFIVQRKDGSISEYGNTADSRMERNHCGSSGPACAISAWALNRMEDSSGNYITYHYKKFLAGQETSSGTGSDEYVLSEVRYTGKRVLPGQTGSASLPYARVLFDYSHDALNRQKGWISGSESAQTRRLDAIRVQDPFTGTPRTVRYYKLNYTTAASNSGARWLSSIQECNKGPDDTGVDAAQVCYPATTFAESDARYQFDTQNTSNIDLNISNRKGVQYGDVDGDGRLDLIWARNTNESVCKARIFVSYGDRIVVNGVSQLTLATPPQMGICLPYALDDHQRRWHLADYDGDGRDDLVVSSATGNSGRWSIYLARAARPNAATVTAFLINANVLGDIIIPDEARDIHLMDINGDGLIDVLYAVRRPNGGFGPPAYDLRGRLRERYEVSQGVFALRFGQELPVSFNMNPDDPCSPNFTGSPRPAFCTITWDFIQIPQLHVTELDGDGRADGMVEVVRYYHGRSDEGEAPEIHYVPRAYAENWRDAISMDERGVTAGNFWYFFVSRPEISASGAQNLAFAQYSQPVPMHSNPDGEMPLEINRIRLADFNGDSLTDVLYRAPGAINGQTWRLRLNTGKGFSQTFSSFSNITHPDLVQVADINGDGRADLLYPPSGNTCGTGDTSNGNRPFCVRYGLAGDGGLGAARHVPGGGAQATSNPFDYEHFFADFDGDGAADYIRLKHANSNPKLFTSRSSSHHQARDVIGEITDGIGAVTRLSYQPLTNASVYRRDTGSITSATEYGRGSPVFDLLLPIYVVSKAASSAPTFENPAAMAEISYRYAGAKIQAGGRGFLGFREISTFDGVNDVSPPRHVVSTTVYRQDFPFIGRPQNSEKRVVASAVNHGSAAIHACRDNPEAIGQQCFYSPGLVWPEFTGTKFSGSVSVWACQGTLNGTACPVQDNPLREACITLSPPTNSAEFNPMGRQQPIFPYLTGSSEGGYAYNSSSSGNGSWLSATDSLFCYEDGFGNLTYSKINQWDGTGATGQLLSSQVIENTYDNDAVNWRLGRLKETTVTISTDCPDGADSCTNWKTRTSRFDYDSGTAKTGLLNKEIIEPGGGATQELRTLYSRDQYGNITHSFQCSAHEADGSTMTDAECKTPSRIKHRPPGQPGEITAVHRYSRSTYDSRGRYSISTQVPYYSASAPNNVSEQTALTINTRDEFGNITRQTDINGRITVAHSGAMGRPYYSGDNTGASSTITYRRCGSVSCPIGAAYRSQTVSAKADSQQAAPTTWAYYDALGRPIVTVVQAFERSGPSDFVASCTYYDRKSRVVRSVEPFFMVAVNSSDGPHIPVAGLNVCAGRQWTQHEYDILGRLTRTTLPDNSSTQITYNKLTTTTINAKGQIARETKNALGQVIQTTQANPETPGSLGMSVNMEYDTHGNLISLRRNAGRGSIVTRHEYDALGRRIKTIDPDRGTEQVFYNAAGEVIRSIDGTGMEVRLDIDALGRPWRRHSGSAGGSHPVQPGGGIFADGFEGGQAPAMAPVIDVWVYDTAANGKGLLHYEERSLQGEDIYRRTLSYDNRGRPASRTTLIDGSHYTESWAYDSLGRPYRETDAAGGTVERTFTSEGYLYRLRNAHAPSEVYQQINAQNARGQITQEMRGAVSITRTYHQQRGWLTGINTGINNNLQQLTYQHDVLGNLTQRKDLRSNQTEDFTYDGLNRLKTASIKVGSAPAVTGLNLTYDNLGNICSKNGQLYTYAGRDGCNTTGTSASASPHAVTQIGSTHYHYNARGELERNHDATSPHNNRWFGYDGLHNLTLVLVGTIENPSAELHLRYGPGGERYRREERIGSHTTLTRYVGSVEYITRPNGIIETKRYIGDVMIETRFSTGAATSKRYLYQDGLGSIDVIANRDGSTPERLSFDGHGNRRNSEDWRSQLLSYTPHTTTHGFTGHEHLDPFRLIHMNGRVYDPQMGRFIQADPVLDAGIQGLNRYSYALNNPLTFTDPSGYSSWNRWLRTIAALVITYYTGGAASSLYAAGNTAGAFAVAAAGGFAAGAVQTGSVKGGLYGAFGAVAFFGVGNAFSQANSGWAYNSSGQLNTIGRVAKTVSHGFVGGVMSGLQGGKFGHGFVAAGATQAVSPQIENLNSAPARTIASATLGGTVSAITGGKFANGAVTAAFSYTLNYMVSRGINIVGSGGAGGAGGVGGAANAFLEAESEKAGQLFCTANCEASAEAAHIAAGNRYLGAALAAKREVTWHVYDVGDGTYSFSYPRISGIGETQLALPSRLPGLSRDSAGHVHWDSNYNFSPQDWRLITQRVKSGYGVTLYLATRNGRLQFSTPEHARRFGVMRGASFSGPVNDFPGVVVPGVKLRTEYP